MMKLRSKFDNFEFEALHLPASVRRRGGLLLLHEIFGIDNFMSADADRWSQLGFEVLVPSLFDRQQPGFVASRDSVGIGAGKAHAQANGLDNAVGDAAACLEFLATRGPVFVIGYCYGGSVAWAAAGKLPRLAAVASYYGSLVLERADDALLCPAILHFGAEDPMIPIDRVDEVRRLRPDLAIHTYAAGHGFNNANGEPAKLARKRTLEFFEQNGCP